MPNVGGEELSKKEYLEFTRECLRHTRTTGTADVTLSGWFSCLDKILDKRKEKEDKELAESLTESMHIRLPF